MRKQKINQKTKKPFTKSELLEMERMFRVGRGLFLYNLRNIGLNSDERASVIFSPINFQELKGLDMRYWIDFSISI